MPRLFTRSLPLLLLALVTACGPAISGVVSVEILGGDRTVPLGTHTLLSVAVTAGSGTDIAVTWASEDDTVATVDADGILSTVDGGSTTITATSVADTTKSDSITVTVSVDPEAASTVDASYWAPVTFPPAVAAGLFVIDVVTPVGPASFTEVDDGFFIGTTTPIGADGSVAVTLPAHADIPNVLFGTADTFLVQVADIAACSLNASAPTVRVMNAVFELVTIPGVGLLTMDGFIPALATDRFIDISTADAATVYGSKFQTWVYSEGAVSVHTEGTGCATVGDTFDVDVDLVEGWNQLAWGIVYDVATDTVTGITLRNSTATELFLSPFFL